jgi:DeoR/GlpR family transcriptional regulator of sugar metabolism
MLSHERFDQILAAVDSRGFVSVEELSRLCGVSEVTIRRDLQELDREKRLRRTHGGAAALREAQLGVRETATPATSGAEGGLVDRVDVLITTPVDPDFDRALLDRASRRGIPIIAESANLSGAATLVATDNYGAANALGCWAGAYAREHFDGVARLLDLTFHLDNTGARSRGFINGLQETLPGAEVVLSIDAQSTCNTAHQLTSDVLDVHPEINLLFAINDTTICGALKACAERRIGADEMLLVTFGLEGDTLRDALLAGGCCRAAVAMFPEVVGPVCIEAAILAHNKQPLPRQLITPYAVLSSESLADFYTKNAAGWQLNWDAVSRQLAVPLEISPRSRQQPGKLPRRIGFVVPFSEHEWYGNLTRCMRQHAERLDIELEVINAEQQRRDDVAQCEREIARVAAAQVEPGDVILIDGGQVTAYLAEELTTKQGITVVTNSRPVLDTLRDLTDLTLISTGGMLRHYSDTMSGPMAESAIRELRADKLFLTATGITPKFGLSHTSVGEVAVKQAMIHAAREVILLADHTKFGQETGVQIAPLTAVTRLITDGALPASTRLELSKSGIEVIIARA